MIKQSFQTKLSYFVHESIFHSVPAFSHVQDRMGHHLSIAITNSFMDMIVHMTYIPIVQLYQ